MAMTSASYSTALKCAPNHGKGQAEYLRTERMPDGEMFIIEECSKPEEADDIGEHYRSIISRIRQQMEAQR